MLLYCQCTKDCHKVCGCRKVGLNCRRVRAHCRGDASDNAIETKLAYVEDNEYEDTTSIVCDSFRNFGGHDMSNIDFANINEAEVTNMEKEEPSTNTEMETEKKRKLSTCIHRGSINKLRAEIS